MGERGDADALLVHDPIGESKFMTHGCGVDLRGVMYDDFLIVGPNTDPAGIRGLKDAPKAFAQIASAGVLFASRGDDSGTHRAELRLWKLAGVEPGPSLVRAILGIEASTGAWVRLSTLPLT